MNMHFHIQSHPATGAGAAPLTMEDDGTYEASDGSGRNSSRKNSIEEALGESFGFWRKARNCQAAACV